MMAVWGRERWSIGLQMDDGFFLTGHPILFGGGGDASAEFCVWWCNVSKLL
jgi:hypothetical protein